MLTCARLVRLAGVGRGVGRGRCLCTASPADSWRLVAPAHFQYELPDASIADRPASPRDRSRLLVCAPDAAVEAGAANAAAADGSAAAAPVSAHSQWRLMRGALAAQLGDGAAVRGVRVLDRRFGDIEGLLGAEEGQADRGPLLVLNKTRVIRARMRGVLVREAALKHEAALDGAGDGDALVAAAEALLASGDGASGDGASGDGAPRVGRETELLFLQPLQDACDDAPASGGGGFEGSVSAPAALCAGSGAAVWRCLLRGKKVRAGDAFVVSARLREGDVAQGAGPVGDGVLTLVGRVLAREGKEAVLRFSFAFRASGAAGAAGAGGGAQLQLQHAIELLGEVPLPPYMRRGVEAADAESYQTVFAGAMSELGGSVAAPTAGLHFSEALLERLARRDVPTAALSLQVGWGTFAPLDDSATADITRHSMHVEPVSVDVDVLEQLAAAAADGGEGARPIVAVGTTSLRTLESLYWWGARLLHEEGGAAGAAADGAWASSRLAVGQWDPLRFPAVAPRRALDAVLRWASDLGLPNVAGDTRLLLTPSVHRTDGTRLAPGLALCDALLTNFHQPRSTLLLLVAKLLSGAASAGDEQPGAAQLLAVYEHALQSGYRFLSYGDACLFITPDASKIRSQIRDDDDDEESEAATRQE